MAAPSEAGDQIIGPAYELEEAALLDQPIDAAVLDANLNGHSVSRWPRRCSRARCLRLRHRLWRCGGARAGSMRR